MDSNGSGDYQASEQHRYVLPTLWRSDGTKRPVLYCPGVGADALSFLVPPNDPVPNAVTEAGACCASFDYGGSALWGNDTARTRVGTARTWLNTRVGAKTDKCLLIGGSMGAATALRWALANPTLVAAIALFIPAGIDIQDVYDNNRGGYQAAVSTAYGGRPSDAQNPAKNAASLSAIPIKIWYSTDDPICVSSVVSAFASASGASTVSLGAVGHSFSASTYAAAVAAFLGAYIA